MGGGRDAAMTMLNTHQQWSVPITQCPSAVVSSHHLMPISGGQFPSLVVISYLMSISDCQRYHLSDAVLNTSQSVY